MAAVDLLFQAIDLLIGHRDHLVDRADRVAEYLDRIATTLAEVHRVGTTDDEPELAELRRLCAQLEHFGRNIGDVIEPVVSKDVARDVQYGIMNAVDIRRQLSRQLWHSDGGDWEYLQEASGRVGALAATLRATAR